MSGLVITQDMLATMNEAQLRLFEAFGGEHKQLVLDFRANKEAIERARAAEDIAFSNQKTFVIGGVELPLTFVALTAYNSLASEGKSGVSPSGKPWAQTATPALLKLQSEAWETLKRVQKGKVAQGETFNLSAEGLRKVLG